MTLGLVPVALMASELGPQTVATRIAAVGVAVSCLAMAAVWLRHHWPTRAQSLWCVIAGSFVIGVAALIVADPVTGLLGTAGYVLLTAFAVCFHSPRMLLVVWTVAAVVIGVLFARLAATDLALAVAATSVVVL
ncbi:MAG: GGDEF domain-containing protein, partial [Dietzia sp.]|nr:GGDEF domain-containing protein [Dietzia sp.]